MFDDIEIEYNGKTRTIKSTEVMRCIAKVEQSVTLPDLVEFMQTGKPRMACLAAGYSALLNYAGLRVTPEQVYLDMFGDADKASSAIEATSTLLALMIPPSAIDNKKKAETETPATVE